MTEILCIIILVLVVWIVIMTSCVHARLDESEERNGNGFDDDDPDIICTRCGAYIDLPKRQDGDPQ